MFNLKNKACQDIFKKETDINSELIECFKNNLTVEEQCEKWNKTFYKVLKKCFRKVRIVNSKKKENVERKNLLLERIRLKKELRMTNTSRNDCHECKNLVITEEILKEHVSEHRSQTVNDCNKCEETFVTNKSLKTHDNIHTPENEFKCIKCSQTIKSLVEKKIHQIEQVLGENISEEYRKEIVETLKILGDDTYSINGSGRKQLWSLLKKNYPKTNPAIPVGKRNNEGKMITDHVQLKHLYLQTYLHRLRNRPGNDDLEEIRKFKMTLFETRLKNSEVKKSDPWKMEQLEKVLKELKIDKARDPNGLINEIFKKGIIGNDLKISLLAFFNR